MNSEFSNWLVLLSTPHGTRHELHMNNRRYAYSNGADDQEAELDRDRVSNGDGAYQTVS